MKRFGNITKYDVERTSRIFDAIAKRVVTSLGPDSDMSLRHITGTSAIGSDKDRVTATKDGYTILTAFKTIDKFEQAIINTSYETTRLNNDSSGDGTTTAYVFFAKAFTEIYKRVYLEFCKKFTEIDKTKFQEKTGLKRRVTSGQFINLMKKAARLLIHLVFQGHCSLVTDYDKLLDIALISLNHDEDMLAPLKELLLELKRREISPRNVNINITRMGTSDSTSYNISNGFLVSGSLYLRPAGMDTLENARALYIGDNIKTMDTVEGIKNFMKATYDHYKNTGERFLIIADAFDDIQNLHYFEKMYTDMAKTEDGWSDADRHVFITEISNKKGIEYSDYIEDMLVYFGGSIGRHNINVSNYSSKADAYAMYRRDEIKKENPEYTEQQIHDMLLVERDNYMANPVDLIKDVIFNGSFSWLPLVKVENANDFAWIAIKHQNDETTRAQTPFLMQHIEKLIAELEETKSIKRKQSLIYRLDNLNQSFATIDIGGTTETEGDILFSATLDAVKAVNSASKKGVVTGMMFPTMTTAAHLEKELHEFNNNGVELSNRTEQLLVSCGISLENYEIKVLEHIIGAVTVAAKFISHNIMYNAGMNEDEITEVQEHMISLYESEVIGQGKKMPLTGYDVLSYEYSDSILSPFESEKAYISGLVVINTFMSPTLFIHADEMCAHNAEQGENHLYD